MSTQFASSLNPPLQPRTGNTLRVLIMTRISTENQDRLSLDDQAEKCRAYMHAHHPGPIEIVRYLTCQASGECVARPDLDAAQELIQARAVDLVIAEDLGRIMRRMEVFRFCEMCEDYDIRLIAINDNVDTASGNWRTLAMFSSLHHELHNRDTSERIKRTKDNRFNNGGTLGCLIYGYLKDTDAKTEDGLHKDPDAEPIYDHIFTMLEDGASYAEVADWLNQQRVPTGPICRLGKWDRGMVTRIVHNPILKGVRQRGLRITRRVNSTGKRRTEKAPPEHLKQRRCPHLAFIEPERYDRIIAMLDARNSKYRRGKNGHDPAIGRPKKRTTWPGQAVVCGICGRPYVWGGHGRTNYLMCSGAKDYRCWNGVTFGGGLAATRITDAVLGAVEHLPDFEPGFMAMVRKQSAELAGNVDQRRRELTRQRKDIDTRLYNLLSFVEVAGNSDSSVTRQKELMAERATIDTELAKLEKACKVQPALPDIAEIKRIARDVFQNLAVNDPAFARRLRTLIPVIQVVPVRCITGGHPLPRARFELKLARLFDGVDLLEHVDEHLTLNLEVDLFDPPQPVRHREAVLAYKEFTRPDGKPYTERQIAQALGVTQPVVQLAMKLHRTMEYLGISDPYQELLLPPDDTNKMRRHKHPRYRFEPLPGYGPDAAKPAPAVDAV